jgi:phosphoribosylaminoimidazole-succinocarboxamide synthase
LYVFPVLTSAPLHETSLSGLTLHRRGKVRDVYEVGADLLIVTTDRISAFDYVLGSGIPDKGLVLTQLSAFWFARMGGLVPHHLIATDVAQFPNALQPHGPVLHGRSMLVRRTEPVPVECVARGYLSGSGWKEYQQTGSVCGVKLPSGLRESDRLPEPIFTPATKAAAGHDENVPFSRLVDELGEEEAERLRSLTLSLYARAREAAERRGLLLADTKLEFGRIEGRLVWIDEAFTPDSSRYWEASVYSPGRTPISFDKQFVRDWLESTGWNKKPPAPRLPEGVVRTTREKYLDAFRALTGSLPESVTP